MLKAELRQYADLLSDYTELRVQKNTSKRIALIKGNLAQNDQSSSSGVSARVRKGGSWGFASHTEITDGSVKKVVESARDNAEFLDSRLKRGRSAFESTAPESADDFSSDKPRLSQKQVMDFITDIDAHIAKNYPDLADRRISLRSLDMEKSVLNSDGARRYSMVPRTNIRVSLTLSPAGEPVEVSENFGGLGQFEDLFGEPGDLSEGIERIYEHLQKKAEGVHPDAGVKDCILDADLAGILAHEAIGHTTEADMVLGGSVAGNYVGKQVASELITLVDFANTCLGELCPVPIFIDDEGTKAEDVVIIEDGILQKFMHNKDSAQRFEAAPTGNARAYQYSDEPLIRMRNTAILPGESKLEDMISSIEDGYYLMKPSNGQADTTSEFMFGVVLGYEIKNGKLGRAIKDTTISGVAFDVLKTVSMVSDDMSWSNGGFCGKKQMIPVGMGGPAVKCRINIGGR